MKLGDVLTIHGKVLAQCLFGSVTCLGHTLVVGKSYPIYSPDNTALATVSVVSTSDFSIPDLRRRIRQYHDLYELTESLQVLGSELACVLLSYLPCKEMEFISQISPFQNLYNGRTTDNLRWCKPIEARLCVNSSGLGVKFSEDHVKAVDRFVSYIDEGEIFNFKIYLNFEGITIKL